MTSGESRVEYLQSPEQRQIFGYIAPLIQQISTRLQKGQPAYQIGQAPQYPDISGIPQYDIPQYGIPQYDIPQYDIPDAPMPTRGWMENLDPSVQSGIMEPWKLGEKQLMETLGGGMGSARGGFSGMGAAGLGEYWAQATPQIGQTAWGMVQPGLQQDYQAQLGQNISGQQQQLAQNISRYQAELGRGISGQQQQLAQNILGYQTTQQEALGQYGTDINQWQMQQQAMNPYQLTGLVGGTYPNPVVSPGSSTGSDMMSLMGTLAMAGAIK